MEGQRIRNLTTGSSHMRFERCVAETLHLLTSDQSNTRDFADVYQKDEVVFCHLEIH